MEHADPSATTSARCAVVIGGGPGGLMAAEVLAEAGFTVTVVEHMAQVGRKLLLAGRGGLNITHSEPLERLLTRYGAAEPRLAAALHAFTPHDLRTWCAELGAPTFVGSSGRVFPEAFRATPLLRAWLGRLNASGVTFRTRTRWLGWGESADGTPDTGRVRVADRSGAESELRADVTVLALGGASWPKLGSDGLWTTVLRDVGIDVAELRAANAGVHLAWSAGFASKWNGEPLKNIAVSVGANAVRGDAMVTRSGLEGGPVYAHGAAVRAALDAGGASTISLDLHPDLSLASLAMRLRGRRPKDSLHTMLRRTAGLHPVAIALLRETTMNTIPTDPVALAGLIKSVPLTVTALMPIERAISTAGGIALHELDSDFMLRRLPGVFAIGEMLDWEAPTGGYLLQATFSTAVWAARAAARIRQD